MVIPHARELELADLYVAKVRQYLSEGKDGPTASKMAMLDVDNALNDDER